jgi:hypothetical protein
MGGGEAHSLAGEGVGESQFRRGDKHCGTLGKYYVARMIERNSSLLMARNSVLLEEETKKGKLHGDTERWKEMETRKKGRRKERKKKCLSVTIRKQIQK